ncbi:MULTISPECIES: dTDP-4-dehydrorhamnose 3,5-epimerase [unclassified Streptosporangium]|uniref:dTDP-4-dehydrorhamnose 3,5-epimerase family protein n=1 Tax=unclassified Streptosporangium TaxID=2632669 RepID=UPI002DD84F00|nr:MULTISPECIES: dTDP-4-dehydrorhamnose 3,5-epimerase [unclassified Streptosporangium]WSA25571.1 dTDP-4-dehydrorhamnose 3,5-epimerase [Streptosporangium sp. NBC_01810]WSD03041.1 dTDP-4-dehydrorhamnose 3,5-epimerase [Streptosporangium sp. NBC_01755]
MFDSMMVTELSVPDAYRLTPTKHDDRRGYFYEAFRSEVISDAIGYPFTVGQANYSSSRRNTLRGIHGTALPPGQAKLVTCVRGAVLDVVVDLRVGSPTYGKYETTLQDEKSGIAVYLADGLGHAFLALTDDACMNYLCSEAYEPGTMLEIDPRDPEIGIPWGLTEPPIMSDKDAGAPTLAEAAAKGLLPTYEDCLAHYAALKAGPQR